MSATVISPQQLQFHTESANGQSSISTNSNTTTNNNNNRSRYPPATAKYADVVRSADRFWETLKSFHESFGNKFKVPTVGGKALDLHRLFVEVTSRGGLEKIIRDRKWKEVIVVFQFPTTITSASFVLRKYYLSLLYHFEQVYYFGKQAPPNSAHDTVTDSLINGSASLEEEGAPDQGSSTVQVGYSVTGIIDGKFDNGYLVTVNLGSELLKGILYHVPQTPHLSESSQATVATQRHRKRSRLALRDPSRPKSNRSGYNFFFAEHYARLKPHYQGQEKMIGKRIGHLWNNLTEAEKQVYQDKGLKDKERYRTEMLEYRSSLEAASSQ